MIDTNSAFIADRLFALGIRVAAVLKVGDDRDQVALGFSPSAELGDIVIGTGGLGPTADDLTTELVAEFLGVKIKHDEVSAGLKRASLARGVALDGEQSQTGGFPEGAVDHCRTRVGTAPGFRVEIGQGKTLLWLSGVPHEMTCDAARSVLPWIIEQNGSQSKISRGYL